MVRERQAEDRIKQEMSFKSLAESVSEMEKFVEQFTRIAAESNQLQAETISCGDSFNFKGKEYWSWNGNAMKPNNPLFLQFGEGLFYVNSICYNGGKMGMLIFSYAFP